MPDWSAYGKKFQPANDLPWWELVDVHHVTHIRPAQRILEDNKIKRGLVYDESKLNTTRTTVNWVSPNYWTHGFRYGTVKFTFDWRKIVSDKNIYWVEAMTDYRPHACRFIVSKEKLDINLPYLIQYDPENYDGPLRKYGNKWYWKNDFTMEIMVDEDLRLRDCSAVEFVSHHKDFCNEKDPNCPEKRLLPQNSARSIMSYILSSGNSNIDHCLMDPRTTSKISTWAEGGLNDLWLALSPAKKCQGAISSNDNAEYIVISALRAVAAGDKNLARNLIGMLSSEQIFEDAINSIVCKHFGFSTFSLP